MHSASKVVTLGIFTLAVVVALAVPALVFVAADPRIRLRRAALVAAGVAAWLGVSGALAASGFFHQWTSMPPRALCLLLPTLALPLALGLSRVGASLAERLPMVVLIGVHAFRLPLELVMHQAALEGTMPVQMSFEGRNLDILTGIAACVVVAAHWRRPVSRGLALAFATLGSTLLIVIVALAVGSLPTFAAVGTPPERLNTWIADFPFVWLPAALVSTAVLFHVVLWRRLLTKMKLPVAV